MKKTCGRPVRASRADSRETMSRRFVARSCPFDGSGYGQDRTTGPGCPEEVFLMNRFYGDNVLATVMARLETGEPGRSVAEALGREMRAGNGSVRGDVLWEILKNGLGTEYAASLIAGLDRFRALGLYDDRIVAWFAGGRKRPATTVKAQTGRPAATGSRDEKKRGDATRGCRDPAREKEENGWRWKTGKN